MWLDGAYGSADGMAIPGTPSRYAADIRLAVDGVHVEKSGVDVILQWAEARSSWHLGSYVRGKNAFNQDVGPNVSGSGGFVNAGLYTRGDCANRVVPVLVALKASRHRLPFTDPFKRGLGSGNVIPLYAHRNTFASKDAWTIWNLCRLLAQRSELQSRFGDRARMEHLLRDIRQNPQSPIHEHLGMRSESIQIRSAMKAAGLVHPLGGRPVPGDPLLTRDEALSIAVTRISSSPYSTRTKVEPGHVMEILDAEYFSVEPWPFSALVN